MVGFCIVRMFVVSSVVVPPLLSWFQESEFTSLSSTIQGRMSEMDRRLETLERSKSKSYDGIHRKPLSLGSKRIVFVYV